MINPEIDIEKIAAALSEENKQANLRWTICAGVSFFAFNLNPDLPTQLIFSTNINSKNIYPALAIFVALTNFVYVISHMSAYKTRLLFEAVCIDRNFYETKIDTKEKFNFGDYFHAMISSNYNRIWPIFANITNRKFQNISYRITKLVIDTSQFIFAPIALIIILNSINFESFYIYIVLFPVTLSILASINLWIISVKYIFRSST